MEADDYAWLGKGAPLKVLVSTFGGDGGKSGISQYIVHLLREFPKVAPDIHFDVLAFEGEEHLYTTGSNGVKPITVRKGLRNPIKNLAWQQFAMPWICARHKYDLLFLPAGNRRLPYWVPCPSVGTFHDFAVLHVQGKYDGLHTLYNLRLLPKLVARLTMIITPSEFSRQDLVAYARIPEERVIVIPEGVTERYYPRDKEVSRRAVAERFGIRKPYILYISRIEHPGKNHVRLIHAFERLKSKDAFPHQLVLAGSEWHGSDEVYRETASCKVSGDIVFTGFAAREDLPDLYCGSDAFVFPSLFEGFGLPVLEAMACGVPVACSNTSSLPEVADNAALMFDPRDEEAIEEALIEILTNQTLREMYAVAGPNQSKRFSWEKAAEQTVDVFRRVIAETPR